MLFLFIKMYFCNKKPMKYDDMIEALASMYLSDAGSRLWIKDRFCMLDNLWDSPASTPHRGTIRFPIKISMSFCIYCRSGKMSLRVQQQEHIVEGGQMLVIFAGQILERVMVEGELKVIFISIDSEYIMTQVRSRYRNRLRGWILRSSEPTLLCPDENGSSGFEKLCAGLKMLLKDAEGDYADGILSGFVTIFGSLLSEWLEDTAELDKSPAESVFLKFQSDVHNFSSRFKSVAYYASRQNISPRHFTRLIKEASGQDPKDIIKEYVILEAKSLLQSGNYSVHEVASKLGFDNDSFFNRYFRKAAGITPGRYINMD